MVGARQILKSATTLSGIVSAYGLYYAWMRGTFFQSMAGRNPTKARLVVSAIVLTSGFVVCTALGFVWQKIEHGKKRRRLRAFLEWFINETRILNECIKTLTRELNIEVQYYRECIESGKEYNWDRWSRLVEICDLIRRASGLYNLDECEEIKKDIDGYSELRPIVEMRVSIVQALDRVHRSLSNLTSRDIAELYRASAYTEDLRDTHLPQLKHYDLET